MAQKVIAGCRCHMMTSARNPEIDFLHSSKSAKIAVSKDLFFSVNWKTILCYWIKVIFDRFQSGSEGSFRSFYRWIKLTFA